MNLDRDLRRRVALGLLGVGLLTLVALVLRGFLPTIVFTVFLYYASRPIYRGLGRLPLPVSLRRRSLPYRRQLQAVTTIVLFLLPFLLLLTYTLVLLIPEIQQVLGGEDQIAAYLSAFGIGQSETLSQAVAELRATGVFPITPEEIMALLSEADVQAWIQEIGSGIVESVGLVLTLALHGFIMLAGTYYLLTDGSRLAGWVLDRFDETGVLEAYGQAVD
ncbi:MAG: AI-2E family transporter, partial [Salinarchaeum sp.]